MSNKLKSGLGPKKKTCQIPLSLNSLGNYPVGCRLLFWLTFGELDDSAPSAVEPEFLCFVFFCSRPNKWLMSWLLGGCSICCTSTFSGGPLLGFVQVLDSGTWTTAESPKGLIYNDENIPQHGDFTNICDHLLDRAQLPIMFSVFFVVLFFLLCSVPAYLLFCLDLVSQNPFSSDSRQPIPPCRAATFTQHHLGTCLALYLLYFSAGVNARQPGTNCSEGE